jgi:hypothetical protein
MPLIWPNSSREWRRHGTNPERHTFRHLTWPATKNARAINGSGVHFIPFHYGCEAIFTPTATKVSRPDVPPFIKLATTTHYNFAISSRFEGIRTTVRPCHIHILTAYRPATGINLVIILPGINVMLTVETIFIAVSILIQANKTSALIKDLVVRKPLTEPPITPPNKSALEYRSRPPMGALSRVSITLA